MVKFTFPGLVKGKVCENWHVKKVCMEGYLLVTILCFYQWSKSVNDFHSTNSPPHLELVNAKNQLSSESRTM